MHGKIKYLLIVCGGLAVMGAQTAVAQSQNGNGETLFTLLLGNNQASKLPLEKTSNSENLPQRKILTTVFGRRLKLGTHASEYLDSRGGRVTISGLNTEDDANADQIIYQIPARSNRAQSLVAEIETRYGQPDEVNGGERIWYIRNPNMRHGQSKIITLRMRSTTGQLTISADRTPITRRGELLVKPQRRLPSPGLASARNTQTFTAKSFTAKSVQQQSQDLYSID